MGRRRRRSRRSGRTPAVLLLLLLALGALYFLYGMPRAPGAAPPEAPPRAEGTLRVHYLDVGQGDATVWELPDGALVIYDCGPPVASVEENPVVRYLRDELDRPPGTRLAALVASHGHLDHIGGCEEILASYDFDHLYEAWYEGAEAPESYRRFQRELSAEGATLHRLPELAPGVRLALPSARATLLWPPAFAPGGWDAIAEASLVVRLEHGARSFCFQGDIEAQQERQLEGRCDVYLVGHHGSRTASSAGWLDRMRPSLAVASYGENSYGHPHPEAMCRIQQAGASLFTTPGSGGIVVETDGQALRLVRGNPDERDFCAN